MTQLAAGLNVSVPLGPRDSLSVATNGGFARVTVTSNLGASQVFSFGPLGQRQVFGSLPEGATVLIENYSAQLTYSVAGKRESVVPNVGYFVGDSYTGGAGATGGNGFAQILAAELAGVASWGNYGWPGYPLSKYSSAPKGAGSGPANAGQIQITKQTVTVSQIGLNDLRGVSQDSVATTGCGPNPDNYWTLRSKVQAMATHFLVPESAKVRMQTVDQTALNPALTFTGSWTRGLNGNSNFVYTTDVNVTVSGTTAPGNILIIRMGRGSAEAATYFDLTVDGVAYPATYFKAAYDGWAQDCAIFRLPSNGAHKFTITSRLPGGGACVLESVDCVDASSDFSAAFVYGVPLYLADGSNIGWGLTGITANSASANGATGGAAWAYGNGASDRFEAAIDSAMNELSAMGFRIYKAAVKAGWSQTNMLSADTIHPNDAGHAHLATKFRSVLRPLFGI